MYQENILLLCVCAYVCARACVCVHPSVSVHFIVIAFIVKQCIAVVHVFDGRDTGFINPCMCRTSHNRS